MSNQPFRLIAVLIVLSLSLCLTCPALADHEKALRHYTAGVSLLEQRKYLDAIGELRLAVHHDFKFADAHAKLAEAYFQLDTIKGRRLAVEEYRLAIRYAPGNPGYPLALGRVQVAQSFDGYAEESFRKAIQIDPKRVDAYLECGHLHIRRWREHWDDLHKALDTFLEAYHRGSTDRELLYHLGEVSNELEDFELAEEVLLRILNDDPSDIEARFQYALALHGQGRLEEAEEAYLGAIRRTGLEDRMSFVGAEGVASPDLGRRLREVDADGAAELARRFWREHDPNLGTRVNERLLEHWRRILKADFSFSAPRIGLRGRDSPRGKTYIRYGPPSHVISYIDESEIATSPGETEHSPRPVQVWMYDIGRNHFRLTFRDRFLDGTFGFPFDPRGGSAEYWEAISKEVPEHYLPEYKGTQIRMIADACSFLRDQGTTRQEIYYAMPAEGLSFQGDEAGWRGELEREIVIYDQDWRVVAEGRATAITRVSGTLENVRRGSLIHQSHFDLKPGTYLAAIAAEDTVAKLMGLAEVRFTAKPFDRPGVHLSDIELARSIRPSDGTGPFRKGGLRVEPAPSHRFGRARPVNLYYEIYGLALAATGNSHFTATVSVIPVKVEETTGFWDVFRRLFQSGPRTPPHVASTFSYVHPSSTVPQHLSLDLSPLQVGTYRLRVSIQDLIAKTTTSDSTMLWIAR